MTYKLPKPMLDGLAREATPADHPSADLLAAFAERTLAGTEEKSVANHMARCGECREVVFLASSAAEPGVTDQQRAAAKPRSRWSSRWVWSVPVAALLLFEAGYLLRMRHAAPTAGPRLASKEVAAGASRPAEPGQNVTAEQTPQGAAPADASPSPVAKTRVTMKIAATLPAKKAEPATADMVAKNTAPAAAEREDLRAHSAVPIPADELPGIGIGGAIANPPPAVPRANGFAATTGEAGQQYDAAGSLNLSVNRAVTGARTLHPGWRVTPQGHLEHYAADRWSRVPADQTTVFRAVGVIGNEVWAGGNGGVLFHSADGGLHWNQAWMAGPSGTETAAIVSISFDDSRHGVVATDAGVSYATSDGGTTWTRQ